MNGKKAKMLRKAGKVDKQTKRQYNSLDHENRRIVGQIYSQLPRKDLQQKV